jgi:hypothetical protein
MELMLELFVILSTSWSILHFCLDLCFGYEPTMCDFGGNVIHLCFAELKPIKVTIPKPTTFKTTEPTCGVFKIVGASKLLQLC